MLLGGHLTEHIELHRVMINLRFPCKVFIVITISSQSKELKKIQTRSVELINNEALFEESFSIDLPEIAKSKRRLLELQYSLYIETKNGVKLAGRLIDSFSVEQARVQKVLNFEKCPDKDASLRVTYHNPSEQNMLDRSKVTTTIAALDYVQENKMKSLINEKSRLQSQLSLIELENYEKDIVIKNLNLQLRLKSEENKYLFTAEKIKEISTSYQQDLKELKKKIVDLDLENKQLKKDIEQAKKQLEINAKQSQEFKTTSISNFSKMLARLEKNLEAYVGDAGDMLEWENREIQEADFIQQTVTKQLSGFERAIVNLRSRYLESSAKCSDLERQVRQNQELLKDMSEQLQKKRRERKDSEKLVEELREELKSKAKQIEELNRNETQELRRAKQQISELNLTVKELRTLVADLQSSNERGTEAQVRLKELIQEQETAYQEKIGNFVKELEKWKGVQLDSVNSHIERGQQLERQLQQLKQMVAHLEMEKMCLEEERKQLVVEVRQYQQQIEELHGKLKDEQLSFNQASNKSKQCMKEISNTNMNIAQSYNKLKIESEYRLNDERAEKAMMKIELQDLRARYETETQELRRRLAQLNVVEKDTINLCTRLGYNEGQENNLQLLVNNFEFESETKIGHKFQELNKQHRQLSGEHNRLKKEYDKIQSNLSDLHGLVANNKS